MGMEKEEKTKILIADDHAIVREGIKEIFERLGQDVEIVAEATNGKEVLEIAQNTPVDVYLLDISMPLMDGILTTEYLMKLDPKSRVIIFSMYQDKILVNRTLKSGARGYILKDCAPEEIIHAVREVHRGNYYLSPSVAGLVVEGLTSREPVPDKEEHALTKRQKEILRLICDGLTEKDIARTLNVSSFTIHSHIYNMMKKLNIHTKVGLIKYAIKKRIVQS
jgi:two-component system, NarL family, response regulator NreC